MNLNANVEVGSVSVFTTDNRGFDAEEISDRAIDKIIFVGDTLVPETAKLAQVYRQQIRKILVQYLGEAQESERKTVYERLTQGGYPEAAQFVKRLKEE
jgi:hypothetical protein